MLSLLCCEIFRPEIELISRETTELPEIHYLEPALHNIPDKLRSSVQNAIDALEKKHGDKLTIAVGYGLCGRGLCGVHAAHATLVFPRVHDCISLLLGKAHTKEHALSREGAIYWSSPGMLESFQKELHLEYHKRFALFEEKFGMAKAIRLMNAEKALFKNYTCLGYIAWPEMDLRYTETAKQVAEDIAIPYMEYQGSSTFVRELLAGGQDKRKFIHLHPGQTIDMDMDGGIIAVPYRT